MPSDLPLDEINIYNAPPPVPAGTHLCQMQEGQATYNKCPHHPRTRQDAMRNMALWWLRRKDSRALD